jgi:hypothetical protein
MLPLLFLLLSMIALIGVGVFVIIGSIRGAASFMQAPDGWFFRYPNRFLVQLFGQQSIRYFHIFIGAGFIIGGIAILLFVFTF